MEERDQLTRFAIDELLVHLPNGCVVDGEDAGVWVDRVAPVTEADQGTLVWLRPDHPERQRFLEETQARVIICDMTIERTPGVAADKVLLRVPRPKSAFLELVAALFASHPEPGIHPAATVHPKAVVGAGVRVGAGAVIHECVVLGKDVVVEAGCVLGAQGFNFDKDEEGRYRRFPHLGRVIIGDQVEIQASSVVDRGVLGDTRVGRGTKIDSHCYIAHNCQVGEDCLIVGHTMLSGSVTLGDRCYVGPGVLFRDGVTVGADAFIGMGSLVVKNLPADSKVMGRPARRMEEEWAIQACVKELIHDKNPA